ncbi:tripartite tricarboxylate transporter substrate binding protein [Roseomonas sp. NAR14]|uniref:Tripartite tricarboxylate transporter substrate binding protein n=1 Tax=Roseomonas acroporae TaxID=2937791 RepID=A0A9X1Y9N1_9PROT|nr:tripartite tricarboxylate transporter substrate binding protein [Roseomonas acroporae]MCK8786093.1 tripartite tricarboxylate transporter substrate binding protein [Roseomonas acroporae]
MSQVGRRAVLAALAAAGAAAPALAQPVAEWPRGLTTALVVPYQPGGPADALGRILAAGLAERLGNVLVVENRPGASTTLAARQVARARPDGRTLLLGTVATFANAPHAFRHPGYDPVADFTHVTLIVDSVYGLVASPRWESLSQVLEAARAAPGRVSYGSQGIGTTGHLPMVDLSIRCGAEFTHVPYSGAAPVLSDLMAGRLDLMFAPVAAAKPLLEEGRIRPLAVALPQRSPLLPGVPTFEELGIRDFAPGGWYSLAAPPGLPEEWVAALSSAMAAVTNAAPFRDFAERNAFIVLDPGPSAMRARLAADLVSQGRLMRAAGLVPS